MAVSIDSHEFCIPKREVFIAPDVEKWEKSEAYQDVLGFLTSLNESVRGKSCSSPCHESDVTLRLLAMLDKMASWLEEFPPVDQPQRYGNKAFKDYYSKLASEAESVVREVVGEVHARGSGEASVYLIESVGNSTRIDYGTGHELAFIMFLTCLFKLGALKQEDSHATVTRVFKRYLELVRQLQLTYKMEPAGSQGVWSLDDYQFVPFIWGSSQLVMNPKIAPEMFTSPEVVEQNAEDYLFLGCIKFILQVKTGPFAEHSNQLWNVSGVQSWSKINQGLIKMYKAEVLHKFPVVQHVLFGSLLSISEAQSRLHQPPSSLTSPSMAPPSMSSRASGGRSFSVDCSATAAPFSGMGLSRKPSLDVCGIATARPPPLGRPMTPKTMPAKEASEGGTA
ncbi:Phosphotyrosyl phosphatase activator PTPA [Trinorchestia longiramus]|nr:Phosphotyrosyl phosphatase activator PTPA [Trinorchestia longiramus]